MHLTVDHGADPPLLVEIDSKSTLLELRYKLFSLTDIAPELLVVTISRKPFPAQDRDESLLLSSLDVMNVPVGCYHAQFPPAEGVDGGEGIRKALNTAKGAGGSGSLKGDVAGMSGGGGIEVKDVQEALKAWKSGAAGLKETGGAAGPSKRGTIAVKDVQEALKAWKRGGGGGADTASATGAGPSGADEVKEVQSELSKVGMFKKSGLDQPMEKFIAAVKGYHEKIMTYENAETQAAALKVVPMEALTTKGNELHDKERSKYPTPRHGFLKALLTWFKEEFYTWVDTPLCWSCGSKTSLSGTTAPSAQEQVHEASRTELYSCASCHAQMRFPRYNSALHLLQTRKGRCGEWAQAFTLLARACGYDVRAVHDWTDHVWTEVYLGGWVHVDACENCMDEPLLYDVGWGKKLNYCIATGRGGVVDVTRRYVKEFGEALGRRWLDEEVLRGELEKVDEGVVAGLEEGERAVAVGRWKAEMVELGEMQGRVADGLGGRNSGSREWVEGRGEGGSGGGSG